MNNEHAYLPLSSEDIGELQQAPKTYRPTTERLLAIACIVSIISGLLNVTFIASGGRTGRVTKSLDLNRPNPYYGLENLPLNVTRSALPDSLPVFPNVFHPVDRSTPNKIFPVDVHARSTFQGRVSPGDHNILLTSEVSMVAQYRVQDFGMEKCTLTSEIPSVNTLEAHNKTIYLHGNTTVQVWNLTAQNRIDPRTLSWDTKPSRGNLLGHVNVATGMKFESAEFYCGASGSLQSFELACSNQDCKIDFWQDYYFKPRFGIFISQKPSI